MDSLYYVRGLRILNKSYIDRALNELMYEDSCSPYTKINMADLTTATQRQEMMEHIDELMKNKLRRNGNHMVEMHINYTYAVLEHTIREYEQYLLQIIADAAQNKPLDKRYFGMFTPAINDMLTLLDKSVNDSIDTASILISLKQNTEFVESTPMKTRKRKHTEVYAK